MKSKLFKIATIIMCVGIIISAMVFTCSADVVVTDGSDFYKLGDCNSDESINIIDLVRMKKYLAGITEDINMASDINGDGKIDTEDLTMMRKNLLGTLNTFTTGGSSWSGIY